MSPFESQQAGVLAGDTKLIIDWSALRKAANDMELGQLDLKLLRSFIDRNIANGPGRIIDAVIVMKRAEVCGQEDVIKAAGFRVRIGDTAIRDRVDDILIETEIDDTNPAKIRHLILLGVDKDFFLALDERHTSGINVTLATLRREDQERPRIASIMKNAFPVYSLYAHRELFRLRKEKAGQRPNIVQLHARQYVALSGNSDPLRAIEILREHGYDAEAL